MNSIAPLLVTLAAVIFVIYLSYLFSKYVAKSAAGISKGKYMSFVDRAVVGQDKSIAIVKVGSRFFLIGITSEAIHLISELKEEDISSSAEELPETVRPESFQDLLQKTLGGKKKKH